MRKLIAVLAVVAAFGLLGVSASGAAALPAEGTMNVGVIPATTPAEGGCPDNYVCIWTGANFSGQLSYWAESNTGCKTHDAFHTFYSLANRTQFDGVIFGSAGLYLPKTNNPTPGATTGNVCISHD